MSGRPPRSPEPSSPEGDLTGQVLDGRYRVLRRLGDGGMSVVYLVQDSQQPGRQFALKAMRTHLIEKSDFVRRFNDEWKILAALHEPGIIGVHGCFTAAGSICIVMDFFEGGSLADRIRPHPATQTGQPPTLRPLPPSLALPLFKQFLRALDHAHQSGIVHRDVKPSNILIDKAGRPCLCDFGIAKRLGQRGQTAPGFALGTPQYMSPEQITSPLTIDHRSDLYSAGIVLYEMLTGRVPFGSDETTGDYQVMSEQVGTEPPDPRQFVPHLHPALVDVLNKALQKDRAQRIQGGGEFVEAIEWAEGAMARPDAGPSHDDRPDILKVQSPEIGETMPHDHDAHSSGAHATRARRYAVFRHGPHQAAAVQIGMNWSALAGSAFWLASARLYGHALLWAASEMTLAILMAAAPGIAGLLLVTLAAIWVLPGFAAERWLANDLRRRGYVLASTVMATSEQAAIQAAAQRTTAARPSR